jgi:hypothetical protein
MRQSMLLQWPTCVNLRRYCIIVFAKSKPLCIVWRTAFRKLVQNGLKVTVR